MCNEKTMDCEALEASMLGAIVNARGGEIAEAIHILDLDYEDGSMTANEYDCRKAELMHRLAEVNEIKARLHKTVNS